MECFVGFCAPARCIAGYHVEGASCMPDTRSCTMEAGLDAGVTLAQQTWTGDGYTNCSAVACATGYSLGFISSFPSFELRTICQAN
jgi:hypothetical protein